MIENKITKAITLIQPNKVTNARYSYNEREENILTLIIDGLQKFMVQQGTVNTDLFGNPEITINVDNFGNNSRKSDYLSAAKGMIKKTFAFDWWHTEYKCSVTTEGVLITTIHNYKNTNYFKLTLNTWALPYMLYWGKGVGGTVYEKSTAISLKGEYTKRMYKLCKRYEDKGGFKMSILEFRQMFCLDKKYLLVADLKKRVLDSAQKTLKKDCEIYFNYNLSKINSRSYNQINFSIQHNNKHISNELKNDVYKLVYDVINLAYPNHQSNKALTFTDRLANNPDTLLIAYNRLKRIKEEYLSNTKPLNKIVPLIKYILREDFKLI